MKCENCSADLAENAKYCPVCKKGKTDFKAVCPYCGNEMSTGSAKIRGTFGESLLFGFGHQHLFFEDHEGNENRIMKSRTHKEAYLCTNCEGVFIPSF